MRESVFQDELLPEAQAMISFPRLILPLSRRDHQDSHRDPCGDGSGVGAEMLSKKRPGIKFRLQLNNTVGIIDSDYFILTMKVIFCQADK